MKNFICLLVFLFVTNISNAVKIIRDEESEKFILKAINPILKAANINIETFKIYILDDKSINAFTVGGNTIFINSGLITNFDDIEVLQGVVSHEIGHLLANHVVLFKTNYRELNNIAIFGNILGIIGGAVLSSGDTEVEKDTSSIANGVRGVGVGNKSAADIAIASSITSNHLAITKIYSHSKDFENQADNIALKLLKKANISNKGLQKILLTLNKYENQSSHLDYISTHPSSMARINNIKQFNYTNNINLTEDKELQKEYQRIVIKFKAFTRKISILQKEYKNYNSNYANYAKAILFYREGKIQEAIKLIDSLLDDHDNDPYMYELKGQILFDGGKLDEAAKSYNQALDLLPNSPIIQLQYAICLVQLANHSNNKLLLQDAKNLIEKAQLHEKENVLLFHYLAVVYGKLGLIADADLAMAEKFILLDDTKQAYFFVKRALARKNELSSNVKLLKINDLLNTLRISENRK